jgi:hypothetical protein
MSDVLNQIVAQESELIRLRGAYESSFIGYVYGMSFDEALILTNDEWKHNLKII